MIHSSLLDNTLHGFGEKTDGDDRLTSQIIIPKQCHGNHVEIVTKTQNQLIRRIPQCDALVTADPGVALTVVTADCVPIIFSDANAHVIGIAHAGWRGTLGNIVERVILRMVERGASTEHIHVAIGPCIHACCYNIYGERKEQFEQAFSTDIIQVRNGQFFLDLVQANRELLLRGNIVEEHIDIIDMCTSCDKDCFYSYHRDGEIQGEMQSFIMMKDS